MSRNNFGPPTHILKNPGHESHHCIFCFTAVLSGIMTIVSILFQLTGSLCFLLFGMKMMSDGIQKTAGNSLHRILGMMTGNRFLSVLTGILITVIIQSSSATTVMVVSFVNAGILNLVQAIGVIFGANIGTTATAWIVSLIGFDFNLSLLAVPAFGIGYILTAIKKWNKQGLGETLMGFGLLFLGLDMLSHGLPDISPENVAFLQSFTGKGAFSIFVGVAAGLIITAIINSSSASTAIIITLAYKNLLTWEFAAAMVLGSNIGTTTDAVLASIGTKVNARRAAVVHVLFNTVGTIIAAIFIHPFLALVDFITPGTVEEAIGIHIAMLHTVFNVLCTLLFLPFINQLAKLMERLVKPGKNETPEVYRLDFLRSGIIDNTESYIIRAEKEVSDMADIAIKMVGHIAESLENNREKNITTSIGVLAELEDYADQMKEGISKYLIETSRLSLTDKNRNHITAMLHIVDELESMTDDCYSVGLLLNKSIEKKMEFRESDNERLTPYFSLVQRLMHFIREHINLHVTAEELITAQKLEDEIDQFRKDLKKVARKRLEAGEDVKTELLYIDVVRHIEKIGDHAFNIAEALSEES